MGMFDSIYILDRETADLVKCAADHRQQNVELQTKDLDARLDDYYIYQGKLYLYSKEKQPQKVESIEYDKLVLVSRESADFCSHISQNITVYASCHYCEPVLTYNTTSIGSGNFQVLERFPFNKWELNFENGILKDVKNVLIESRKDIKDNKNNSMWSDKILDDQDSISKSHMELLYKRNLIKKYED